MVEYPTDEAEAVGVVQAIAAEVRAGRRPRDIAVLFRTNGQSPAFEQALTAAGIPYLLRGGERFFARKEVKEGILMLRAARAAAGARPRRRSSPRCSPRRATRTPPPAGASRQKWESLKALVDLAETHQAASERRFPSTPSSPTSPIAPSTSSPPTSRASRSPRSTPRRASNGTASTSSG